MKPKGKLSVRKAVSDVYPDLPEVFSMMKLHSMVCRETCRPYLFLDTTRRKVMELREEGLISFKNIDKERSIYQKTDNKN